MNEEITITNLSTYCGAFGEVGLKVNSRTGPNRRTKADTEWFVMRRFLKPAIEAGVVPLPLKIKKEESFDFLAEGEKQLFYIEITQATSPRDQQEMAISEKQEVSLIGEHGGRFEGGGIGNHPERVWAADVHRAIRRKRTKSIFQRDDPNRHLVIYVNSNAELLADEVEAFALLSESIGRFKVSLLRVTRAGIVHVVASNFVCLDILGEAKLVRRDDHR